LTLMLPSAPQAKNTKQGLACDMELMKCSDFCAKLSAKNRQYCSDECGGQHKTCYQKTNASGAGVQDTGGTGKPPKAGNGTSPGGGVATDPKAPPKTAGPRAPVSGGVYSKPTTTGAGGSTLRSGGKR